MTDQAKYQLAIDNTVDFPVTLEIKSGRVTKTFNMRLTGRRLSVPEWNRFFGPNADNPSLTTADFLRFHALVNDAFVRGVHVHDDHAGGVFGQHVDAVDLRDGAA